MIFTDNTNLTKLIIYNMQDLQKIFDVKFWDDMGYGIMRYGIWSSHFTCKVKFTIAVSRSQSYPEKSLVSGI